MSDIALTPKPKKSVALSGVVAGNTALCTVGRTGNDLSYRGFDILDIAGTCEFEEIAHLLIHGKLPSSSELIAYRRKLVSLRGLPAGVKIVLEALPETSHPMDVLRTGVSALGCLEPEGAGHPIAGAQNVADRLIACLGSMLCYWYQFHLQKRRIEVETNDESVGAHFLHLLHGTAPSAQRVRAMHTSLILYAEHEFNASTFTARVIAGTGSDMYSSITGAIGALRGPKHGGANEVAFEIQNRYQSADEAEADIRKRVANKEVIIGFGHPVYTIADPRNQVIKEVARQLALDAGDCGTTRGRHEGNKEHVSEPGLVLRGVLQRNGYPYGDVYTAVRDLPNHRLGCTRHRTAAGWQDYPSERQLHRPGSPAVRAAGEAKLATPLFLPPLRLLLKATCPTI